MMPVAETVICMACGERYELHTLGSCKHFCSKACREHYWSK